jgi:predicted MFS family arabinose efflux permease
LLRISSIPALAVLQIRDFRILWTARVIHEVSRRMELLVLGYLILQLTDSAFQVGLIAVFLNAPRPVLSLFAGVVADRLDRQRVLVGVHACFFAIATALLVLLITHLIQPWHVFLATFLQGSAKVLDDPCRRTAMFDLAGRERIASAMSLETISNNGGKILGPLAGGLLIAGASFAGAYALLVALDLVSLLLMVRLRLPHQKRTSRLETTVWQSLREGIEHSMTNRMVLGVLCISLVLNALVLPIQYFIPVIATDLLKVGPTLGGLLGSAEGFGTLVGASIIAVRRDIRYHGLLFVAGALMVSLAVMIVGWSPWFALSFTLLLLGGIAQAGFSTMQSTILLLASAPEIRGRIVGASGTVNGLGHLLGGWETGVIASAFNIGLAVSLNAGAALLLVLPVIFLTPLVWRPLATIPETAADEEKASPPQPSPDPGGDYSSRTEVEQK